MEAGSGAKINLLRWKRFVESEDVAFMKIVDAFQKATGVTITVSNESYDDLQPKASVAAQTGQGLDMVWGLYSLPFLFPNKCTDMSDVADYLGKKGGGWSKSGEAYGKLDGKWIGVPVAATGALVAYRVAAAEKAGHKEFPKDLAGFADLVKGLNKNGTPAGMAVGHASGDANTWLYWALWAHGGNLTDANNKVVINSPETAKALEYVKGLYDNFIPGTASWNDSSNNKAFLAGQLHLTVNGISIYITAKKENPQIAADMNHAHLVAGVDRQDQRNEPWLPDPGVQLHQVSAGLQGVHRLHDGSGPVQSLGRGGAGLSVAVPARLHQEPDLDRRSQEHALSQCRGEHADAGGPRPDGRERGRRDCRLCRGRHVRELLHRSRGCEDRDGFAERSAKRIFR